MKTILTKNNLLYVLLCTFIIAIAGCCREKKTRYSFTQEDLEWLFYDEGDTLFFKSNTNDRDTFIITDIARSIYGESDNCSEYIYETACMSYRSQGSTPPSSGRLIDIKKGSNKSGLGGGSMSWQNPVDVYLSQLPSPIDNVEVDNIIYNDVYIYEHDITETKDNQVYKFYFNLKNGILRYDIKNGEYWVVTN